MNMTSITSVSASGAFYDILATTMPTLTSTQQQTLWNDFLTANNYSSNPDQTPQILASFSQYVQSIAQQTPPTSGYFFNTMQTFFPDASPRQIQSIWSNFLNAYNYVLPPDPSSLTVQKNFVQSILQQYAQVTNNAAASPNAQIQRRLMFNVFNALIILMQTFQTSVGTMEKLLAFYSNYALQYTRQISHTFFYESPTANNGTFVPNADPKKFVMGYQRITTSEMIQYVVHNQTSFDFGRSVTPFSDQSSNQLLVKLMPSLAFLESGPFTIAYSNGLFTISSPFYNLVSVKVSPNQSENAIVSQCEQAFQAAYAQPAVYTNTTIEQVVAQVVTNAFALGSFSTTINTDQGVYTFHEGGNSGNFTLSLTNNGATKTLLTYYVGGISQTGRVGPIMNALNTYFNSNPSDYLAITHPGTTTNGVFTPTTVGDVMSQTSITNYQGVPVGNYFEIPWRYQARGQNQTATDDITLRSNQNNLLQQYIANTQAKQSVIKQKEKSEAGTLQTSQQAIQGFDSILQSSINDLETILSMLFQ